MDQILISCENMIINIYKICMMLLIFCDILFLNVKMYLWLKLYTVPFFVSGQTYKISKGSNNYCSHCIYLSLYTQNPSECWSLFCAFLVCQSIEKLYTTPFVFDFELAKSLWLSTLLIFGFHYCYGYFDFNSCLLPCFLVFGLKLAFDYSFACRSVQHLSDYLVTNSSWSSLHLPWSASGSLLRRNMLWIR